jgi:peptidoglycan/LPS O-acetylase OafA/YrhL
VKHDQQSFLPALEGIRGLASVMVLIFHASIFGWNIPIVTGMGNLGVMLFFTLSGFLMAYHYMPTSFSVSYWAAFYLRRFLRIYPAYFFVISACYLLRHYLPQNNQPFWYDSQWNDLLKSWLMSYSNNPGIFWTIPAELCFYVFYPIIAILLLCIPAIRFRIALMICSWFLLLATYGGFASYFSVSMPFFLGGIVAANLLHHYSKPKSMPGSANMLAVLCLLSMYMLLWRMPASLFSLNGNHLNYNQSWFLSPLLAVLVLSIALSKGFMTWLFAIPPARFLGKISYSVYLVHMPVQVMEKRFLPADMQSVWIMLLLVLLTSMLFYGLVEAPFHRLGKRMAQRLDASHSVLS